MYKKATPLFLITQSPLHVGSGTELGFVDLPIQREKHTEFPKIESSGIKGCLREAFESRGETKDAVPILFGPEEGDKHAGCLGFTDGRLLLFPVKSVKKVAWITCPMVLNRFSQDLQICGKDLIPDNLQENVIPAGSQLIVKDNRVVLEELTFEVKEDKKNSGKCSHLANWLAEKVLPEDGIYDFLTEKIKKDIVVLSNDDFSYFVNNSTEIYTRTKINPETGTVQSGSLFTEEYLPSESIIYSIAMTTPVFKTNKDESNIFEEPGSPSEEKAMEFFLKGLPPVIQLGGNSTLGKGIVRIRAWRE
ncbi:MAG: type III-B CRISPR module RAMP protein Cmr4 [Candidatus Aenigmatarchaeota archaeon]